MVVQFDYSFHNRYQESSNLFDIAGRIHQKFHRRDALSKLEMSLVIAQAKAERKNGSSPSIYLVSSAQA